MRLYLDIDGVLTANPDSIEHIESLEINDALVEWRQSDVHRLLNAFDEVVWATTWIFTPQDLDTIERHIDVKHDRVQLKLEPFVKTKRTGHSCGKLPAVRSHFNANPAPFMLIDDEMGSADHDWARSVGGECIRPLYDEGGVYAMLDQILSVASKT